MTVSHDLVNYKNGRGTKEMPEMDLPPSSIRINLSKFLKHENQYKILNGSGLEIDNLTNFIMLFSFLTSVLYHDHFLND